MEIQIKAEVTKKFNSRVELKNRQNIQVSKKTKRIEAQITDSNIIRQAILSNIIIGEKTTGTGGVTVEPSIRDIFTIAQIVNNKLTIYHGFNQREVDLSVFDDSGVDISVPYIPIDVNRIELDFTRIDVNGTWSYLVER